MSLPAMSWSGRTTLALPAWWQGLQRGGPGAPGDRGAHSWGPVQVSEGAVLPKSSEAEASSTRHCSTGLYLQNTSSKIKWLRISRQRLQGTKEPVQGPSEHAPALTLLCAYRRVFKDNLSHAPFLPYTQSLGHNPHCALKDPEKGAAPVRQQSLRWLLR